MPEHVQRLCSSISSRGHGLVGPSTYLSPYQVLLLGQGDTLDLLEAEMRQYLPAAVTLRRRPNHWPPLHTPLVWERSVPNRAAVALYHTDGGHQKPKPTVVSCTTGRANYDEWNSREILTEWTDHPQRLWDVLEHTLASGAELIVHVGPEPKLIPTAFDRLSGKIMKQLKSRHLDRPGAPGAAEHQPEPLAGPQAPAQCRALPRPVRESSDPGGLAAGPGCGVIVRGVRSSESGLD